MKKYIIRETEQPYLEFYFDGDMFNENSGDFCNTLFILYLQRPGRLCGLNADTFNRLYDEAEEMGEYFEDVRNGYRDTYRSYKEIMLDLWGWYNPRACHLLKESFEEKSLGSNDQMAAYLTVKTGKHWTWTTVFGYCQGDIVDILYCDERYKSVEEYGEVFLGCAKEFGVIELDDEGEEADSCWGYIVADCLVRDEIDYKKIVADWAGIPFEEAELQLISGSHTVYDWEIVA